MRKILVLLLVVAGLMSAVIAQDTDEIANLGSKGARVTRAPNGARLTAPSNAARPEIVSSFLRGRHDAATIGSLVVSVENVTSQGPVHVRMHQRVAGLDVYGTYVRATMTPAGELVSVIENLAPAGPALLPASIDYRDALASALQRRYPGAPSDLPEVSTGQNRVEFARGERFYQNPVVTRMAIPLANGRLRIGYLVETWDRANQLWHTIVNGNGRVIFDELRTASDSYNVFTNAPNKGAQVIVSGPGTGNAESPAGWVTNNTTIGNNVDAYLDANADDLADANSRPVSAAQDFNYAFDAASSPSTATNRLLAITNLFYLNNVLHDRLYRHGFTEAAGNFQTNNFGKGGSGNDPVNAEAQDGSGTNNANFSTPADGSRPRMQMYLWSTASPSRDGDLDSDIVYHEYGHGLTWRMIGGMSGPFAGAIGEGMSDVLALYINDDDRLAEYSANSPLGIRRFPYTNYPNTYGDMGGSRVHDDGEIYAAAMWKLRQLWLDAGLSEESLWNRVVDGMNSTPSRPAYEDMRDGILAAINSAGASTAAAERCRVWTAFAQFGIGSGANGTESCTLFRCRITVTESFTIPSGVCSAPSNTAPSVSITAPANNSSFVQGTAVTFTASVTDAEGGPITTTWTSNVQGTIGSGTSFTTSSLSVGTHDVTATAQDQGGLQGTATVRVVITTPSEPPPSSISLSVRGYKVKGVQHADLTWSGATSTNVDVFRNGTRVTTVPNSGAYTDVIGGKGAGTFTYKVCEAGSATACSSNVTIVF